MAKGDRTICTQSNSINAELKWKMLMKCYKIEIHVDVSILLFLPHPNWTRIGWTMTVLYLNDNNFYLFLGFHQFSPIFFFLFFHSFFVFICRLLKLRHLVACHACEIESDFDFIDGRMHFDPNWILFFFDFITSHQHHTIKP